MPITLIEQLPKFEKKVEGTHKLMIAELFCDTIQGEGINAGMLSTFIRLQGCTLQCVWCFHENTPIVKQKGHDKIKDLKPGDIILTLDENEQLVETTVKQVLIKEEDVKDLIAVYFDGVHDKPIVCTKEHPFYVKDKGWIKAGLLKLNDIILGPSGKQTLIFKAKKHNSQFQEQVVKKTKETNKKLRELGIFKPYFRTDENKKIMSDKMMGEKNPMKNPETVKKASMNSFKNKSNLEKRIEKIFLENSLPILYTGNNKLAVGDKKDRYRFPDFVVEGQNKLIEVYHTTMKYSIKGNKSYRGEEWENYTRNHYKKFKYETLFLTEKDLINKSKLKEKIFNFIYNGSTITKISDSLNSKQRAALFGNSKNEKTKVYNLSCEPYNTYLVHGKHHHKWVHNCDTLEVWRFGNEYTYEEVFQMFEQNDMISKFKDGQSFVLTGGSPLKQQEQVIEFIEAFIEKYGFKPYIQIENESVLMADTRLEKYIDCWNNSPKLANSGMKERVRLHPIVISQLAAQKNSWFKFVIATEDDWDEIEKDYLPFMNRSQIILMPEGVTQEELSKNRKWVAEMAIQHRVRYSDRLHIVLWNKKTSV
jgi:organic radical activating enzyme